MQHATRTQFVVIDRVARSSTELDEDSSAARRFALRERTAAAHAALDEQVGRLDSMGRYADYLKGMLQFRAPVEEAVATPLVDWRPRTLATAIRADLADLRLPVPAAPARRELHPYSACPSGLLGILYVLEGAALGARLLYRDARALGLSDSHGARHLALQAADAGAWRGFLALLERSPVFDLDRAASAALATFALAHHALIEAR